MTALWVFWYSEKVAVKWPLFTLKCGVWRNKVGTTLTLWEKRNKRWGGSEESLVKHVTLPDKAVEVKLKRLCAGCEEEFEPTRGNQIRCKKGCRRKRSQKTLPPVDPSLGYRAGRISAASELRVASALLCEGWEVYRALSANAPCDLIAGRGDTLLRVQVKTAGEARGVLYYNQPYPGTFDLLVLVLPDKMVFLRDDEVWDPKGN